MVGVAELKDAKVGKANAVGTLSWAPKNTSAIRMLVNTKNIAGRNLFT
jgi:hypothetical protein